MQGALRLADKICEWTLDGAPACVAGDAQYDYTTAFCKTEHVVIPTAHANPGLADTDFVICRCSACLTLCDL